MRKRYLFRIPYLKKTVAGLCGMFVLLAATGYISRCSFHKSAIPETPRYEIYPKEEIAVPGRIPKPKSFLPKVAIIIDDMGYDSTIAEKFLSLNVPLTFSVFPHSPSRDRIIRSAKAKGQDIMLHLPMEPVEYPAVDPGPGALLTCMSPDQIISRLNANLDSLSFVKGVNNHMGSRMTAVSTQMYQILSALKKRDLFFIDSLTTSQSLCRSCAHILQIPFAQRDVFLDHVVDAGTIRIKIGQLIRIADHYGEAVGIGHPHPETYNALREMLPELKKEVELVPASEIVHTAG
jgi:uncharacterized protein